MGTPHKVFHSLLDLEALDSGDSSPPRLASSSPLLAFYLGPLRSPAAIVLIYNRGLSSSLGIKDNGIGGIRAESKERHKVMVFVGIQMGFGSMGGRRSLRKTWFPSDREGLRRLEASTGLAFRFVIGWTGDKGKWLIFKKKLKNMMIFCCWISKNNTAISHTKPFALFDADFYVKADDDIYLRPAFYAGYVYCLCQ